MESNVALCLINKVSEKVDIICTEQQEKLQNVDASKYRIVDFKITGQFIDSTDESTKLFEAYQWGLDGMSQDGGVDLKIIPISNTHMNGSGSRNYRLSHGFTVKPTKWNDSYWYHVNNKRGESFSFSEYEMHRLWTNRFVLIFNCKLNLTKSYLIKFYLDFFTKI